MSELSSQICKVFQNTNNSSDHDKGDSKGGNEKEQAIRTRILEKAELRNYSLVEIEAFEKLCRDTDDLKTLEINLAFYYVQICSPWNATKFHFYANRVVESGIKNSKIFQALGESYENGVGVPINLERALILYFEAQKYGGRKSLISVTSKYARSLHEQGKIKILKPNRTVSENLTQDDFVPYEDVEFAFTPNYDDKGNCDSLSVTCNLKQSASTSMEADNKHSLSSSSSKSMEVDSEHSSSSTASKAMEVDGGNPSNSNVFSSGNQRRPNIRTDVLDKAELVLYSAQEIAKLERESTATTDTLNANLALYYFAIPNPNPTKFHLYAQKVVSKGFVMVESFLGFCYENGYGIEQNILLALRHYEEARRLGEKRNFSHLTAKLFNKHKTQEIYKHLANVPLEQIETLHIEINFDENRVADTYTFCHRQDTTNREVIKQAFKNQFALSVPSMQNANQNISQSQNQNQSQMFSYIQHQRNSFKKALDKLTLSTVGSNWKFSVDKNFYWLKYPNKHTSLVETALKTHNIQFKTQAVAFSSNENRELVTSVSEADKNLFMLAVKTNPEDYKSNQVGHYYKQK